MLDSTRLARCLCQCFDRWVWRLRLVMRREEGNEPVGRVRVKGKLNAEPPSPVDSTLVRGNLIAQLIDELPLLAVVGTQMPGGIEIRDAAELRRKESDRISTTVKNLRAMGAEVEEFEDGLRVHGRTQLRGAMLDSYGDHRIAMAFAVAALTASGDSEIAGAEGVASRFLIFSRSWNRSSKGRSAAVSTQTERNVKDAVSATAL